jgi:hypothetical protein
MCARWDLKCPVFSTEVGMRPAEPCSVSVAATHQILTQILLYLMRKVQLDHLEEVAGGKYSVEDFKVLEELNHNNIAAMEEIVGYTRNNKKLPTKTEKTLRDKGRYWALQTPMSWMCSATYVLVTFYCGYPIVFGLAQLVLRLQNDAQMKVVEEPSVFLRKDDKVIAIPGNWKYLITFLDAAIYIFMPQWTVLMLRGLTGRRFLHRMVGRGIVVGDVPWVAQCVEAYLSKLFACAYSATSIAVYSGNPSDHLVHRMTHRVVRGGLVACGRPDGRLMALTSAEASVCLSVSQASSILSIGSTCESLTIGHNPHALGLAAHNIFLPGVRKQFLCENILERAGKKVSSGMSPGALLGAYTNMRRTHSHAGARRTISKGSDNGRRQDESVHSLFSVNESDNGMDQLEEEENELTKHVRIMNDHDAPLKRQKSKNDRKKLLGSIHEKSCRLRMDEAYYGQHLEEELQDTALARLCDEQKLAMRLYESRIGSLQRCVAFFVLFHAMAKRVADFWPSVSLGYLKYEIDRTHSIMRIATTASPVSGAEVRDRTMELAKIKRLKNSKHKMLGFVKARRDIVARQAAEQEAHRKTEEERQAMLSLLSPEQRQLIEAMGGLGSGSNLNAMLIATLTQEATAREERARIDDLQINGVA